MTSPQTRLTVDDLFGFLNTAEKALMFSNAYKPADVEFHMSQAALSMAFLIDLRSVFKHEPIDPEKGQKLLALSFGLHSGDSYASLNEELPSDPDRIISLPTPSAQSVALYLMSCGINPWNGVESGQLPHCLELAIKQGAASFVSQALDLPQAPSFSSFLESTDRNSTKAIDLLVQSNTSSVVLKRLAKSNQGSIAPSKLANSLGASHHAAFPHLVSLSSGPFTEKQKEKARKVWALRVSSSLLRESDVRKMFQVLGSSPDNTENIDEVMGSGVISRLLSPPWMSYENYKSVQDLASFTGAKGLCQQGRHHSGPMAGQWNGLAAACMGRIRSYQVFAAPYDHLSNWFKAGERGPGVLSSALGQQWRPGIGLDGFIWLGVYGTMAQSSRQKLALFGNIDNPAVWERQAVDEARKATCAILQKNTINPQFSLIHIWAKALRSSPEAARRAFSWSQEEKFEFLMSLTNDFSLINSTSMVRPKQALSDITGLLFTNPALPAGVPQEPSQEQVVLETLLSSEMSSLEAVLRQSESPQPDNLALDSQSHVGSKRSIDMLNEIMSAPNHGLSDGSLHLVQTWARSTHSQSKSNSDKFPHLKSFSAKVALWTKTVRKANPSPLAPRPGQSPSRPLL